jgi:hypothetical protein
VLRKIFDHDLANLQFAFPHSQKGSRDAERGNEQHQPDQDQHRPARADVVFCDFGIEA